MNVGLEAKWVQDAITENIKRLVARMQTTVFTGILVSGAVMSYPLGPYIWVPVLFTLGMLLFLGAPVIMYFMPERSTRLVATGCITVHCSATTV
jgi:hypothetical protein